MKGPSKQDIAVIGAIIIIILIFISGYILGKREADNTYFEKGRETAFAHVRKTFLTPRPVGSHTFIADIGIGFLTMDKKGTINLSKVCWDGEEDCNIKPPKGVKLVP